jgi:hypothetical protein
VGDVIKFQLKQENQEDFNLEIYLEEQTVYISIEHEDIDIDLGLTPDNARIMGTTLVQFADILRSQNATT